MKRIRLAVSLLMISLMISLPAWAGTFKDDCAEGNLDGGRASMPVHQLNLSGKWITEY